MLRIGASAHRELTALQRVGLDGYAAEARYCFGLSISEHQPETGITSCTASARGAEVSRPTVSMVHRAASPMTAALERVRLDGYAAEHRYC